MVSMANRLAGSEMAITRTAAGSEMAITRTAPLRRMGISEFLMQNSGCSNERTETSISIFSRSILGMP